MGVARLTRREKQAHTRSCLMESAARVFARRGLAHASIDEVAEDAGFTKGAFYANFASKEELFLAMLDERFDERIGELDRVAKSDADIEGKARQAGEDFTRFLRADPEWQRLFLEFAAHASRHEDFRRELVTRYGTLRARIAEIYRQRVAEVGGVPPFDSERVALMTFAMANGIALESLLEPDLVSEDLFAGMLAIFFTGLQTMAQRAPAVPAPS